MMRHRRLGQAHRVGEVAHAHLPRCGGNDKGEQLHSCRVAESLEHAGEIGSLLIAERERTGRAARDGGCFDGGLAAGHAPILPNVLTFVDRSWKHMTH